MLSRGKQGSHSFALLLITQSIKAAIPVCNTMSKSFASHSATTDTGYGVQLTADRSIVFSTRRSLAQLVCSVCLQATGMHFAATASAG